MLLISIFYESSADTDVGVAVAQLGARKKGPLTFQCSWCVRSPPPPALSPPGEGEHLTLLDNFSILMAVTDSVSFAVRHRITQPITWLKTRRMISPSPGGEGRGGHGA